MEIAFIDAYLHIERHENNYNYYNQVIYEYIKRNKNILKEYYEQNEDEITDIYEQK